MMKQVLTFILLFGILTNVSAQGKFKNPRLRMEAGPVFSTFGSTQSISNNFFPSKYLNKPFLQAKLAFKLNRKYEFNASISKSSLEGTTTSISDWAINNQYGSNYSFDLNYTMISLGVKKFLGKSISPIGRYLEVGVLFSKQQASSFNYIDENGNASVYQIYSANRPSARIAFGKRNMITQKLYFFREFAFCVNQFSLSYNSVNTVNKRTFFYSNSLTNFNFLLGVGVVL